MSPRGRARKEEAPQEADESTFVMAEEEEAVARYETALAEGFSDAEARELGWPEEAADEAPVETEAARDVHAEEEEEEAEEEDFSDEASPELHNEALAEPDTTPMMFEVARPHFDEADELWVEWAWSRIEGLKEGEEIASSRVYPDEVVIVSTEARKYKVPR